MKVRLVAPKVGGARLSDGSLQAADGQLAGTPSVLFDAVALVLSEEGGKKLESEAAAIDFVRDAFGHLKTIAHDDGAAGLLRVAGIQPDAGVLAASAAKELVAAAGTRHWDREAAVRTLA
ncbi:MAG: hypothetical protein EOP92_17835 [Lysobacteraceae bacterium]|nr:MAG: hypothetical protein EOP92_17835 [Xanthomonadaceae bacterium]